MSDTEILNQILEELKKLNNKKVIKKEVTDYTFNQIYSIVVAIYEFYNDKETHFITSTDLLELYNDLFIDNPELLEHKIPNMSCRKMKSIIETEIPIIFEDSPFIKYTQKHINYKTHRGYIIDVKLAETVFYALRNNHRDINGNTNY